MKVLRWFISRLPTAVALSFDEYQRYKFVSRLISKVEGKTILDVGGGGGVIRRFLKNKEILILDLNQGDVIGTGAALPFRDGSFDGAISVDTLQYIPKGKRERFLSELVRVARRYVIITSPFAEPARLKAEKECNQFYRKLFGEDYFWFKDSINKGLPEFTQVAEAVGQHKVEVYDSGSLRLWVVMLKLHFLLRRSVSLYPLNFILNGIYNVIICRLTKDRTPSVRKVIQVRLGEGQHHGYKRICRR